MKNIELASYTDDNTPYALGNDVEELIVKLQNTSKTLFQWLINSPSYCFNGLVIAKWNQTQTNVILFEALEKNKFNCWK